MLTRPRILLAVGVLAVVAAAFTGWQAFNVQKDLAQAESSVNRIQRALDNDDVVARDAAIDELTSAASDAADTTSGPWWGALTLVPLIGDDFEGIEVLSSSLDLIASEGIRPVADSVSSLDDITKNGRINLQKLKTLQEPLRRATSAFSDANSEVSALDSAGYFGTFGSRFDEYAERLDSAASSIASADKAAEVLPSMLGGNGPRDYLLIFQNNAEIRATGGLPGSWALVHADNGKLDLTEQGSASDFGRKVRPVLPITAEEDDVYSDLLGVFFQDAGFTPDFPRASQLWNAHWSAKYPERPLDGILALDPVGLSYLIEGTGPVTVGDLTLTAENLVEQLLNKPYITLDTAAQDALFEDAAAAVFKAATVDLAKPMRFVEGMSRSAREGRFLVAPFVDREAEMLAHTDVLGAISGDDGPTPHIDIGLNDATGSKMSYYLRYSAEIEARTCSGGTQSLAGMLTLRQAISPADAAELPSSVTGGGKFGTQPGSQFTVVRIYGPHGGAIDDIRLGGRVVPEAEVLPLNGRPTVTLALLLENRNDLIVTWKMSTAKGQTGDVEVRTTPSVVPGKSSATVPSACP
ncbi:DUF4012 domain-containing protein [Nocardioides salsibiostraticola]